MLTVLLPRLRTRQLRYADLPASAVTFFGTLPSKYGSLHFGFMMTFSDDEAGPDAAAAAAAAAGNTVLVSENVL